MPVSYIGLPEVRRLLVDYREFLSEWKDLPFGIRIDGKFHSLCWGDDQNGGGIMLKCDQSVMNVISRGSTGRVRIEFMIGNCVVHRTLCDMSDNLNRTALGVSFREVVYRYSDAIRDVTNLESEGRMSITLRMQLSPPWCLFGSDICVIGVYVVLNPVFVYRSIYRYLDYNTNLNLYEWLKEEWRKRQMINYRLSTS